MYDKEHWSSSGLWWNNTINFFFVFLELHWPYQVMTLTKLKLNNDLDLNLPESSWVIHLRQSGEKVVEHPMPPLFWSSEACHSALHTLDLSRNKYRGTSSAVKTLKATASFVGKMTLLPPCHQREFGRTITGVSVTARWRLLCLPKSSPFPLMSHYGYVLSQLCSLAGWVSETARQRRNG